MRYAQIAATPTGVVRKERICCSDVHIRMLILKGFSLSSCEDGLF